MTPKTAIVTGASRGLGATLAGLLAAEGYGLVVGARQSEGLERMATALRDWGAEVIAVAGDVAEEATRRRLVEAAGRLGGLDLLVNNASDLGPSPMPALADYPPARLRAVFEVNVLAPLALVQEALPLLRARRGLVVDISSDAALGGYEGWGGYGASKAALDLISKTLAAELQGEGVAVVAVDPGDMRTDMHQDAYPGEDISDRPLPEVTLPFWAWLLGQEHAAVNGRRFGAQADTWQTNGAQAAAPGEAAT